LFSSLAFRVRGERLLDERRADPAVGAFALSLWTEAPKAIADLVGEGAEAARMTTEQRAQLMARRSSRTTAER